MIEHNNIHQSNEANVPISNSAQFWNELINLFCKMHGLVVSFCLFVMQRAQEMEVSSCACAAPVTGKQLLDQP